MLGRVKGYRVCSESSEAPLGPMFFTSLRSMSAFDRRHAWDGGGGAGILPEHEQLAQLGGAALSAQKSCSSCSVVLKCSLSCFKQNPQSDFLDPFSWQSRVGVGWGLRRERVELSSSVRSLQWPSGKAAIAAGA